MEYRRLGKLDWKPSALGFGTMRLPTAEGSALSGNITQKEADRMIHYAIDNGVNFFDSAYLYHSGKSEEALGKALSGGWRNKVKIATKSPLVILEKEEDFNRILDEQLKRLGVEMIDFYLLHNIFAKSWETVKRFDLIAKAEAAQKAGKIGHISFSFHDEYKVFEEVINAYDKWAYCQVQYNFMDEEIQAGKKGLKLAASKDIGVVVMEPLRGGKLTNPIPEAAGILKKKGLEETLISLALRWIWNQPEVSTVLSGMSEMQHVIDNIEYAGMPFAVSEDEYEALAEIKRLYEGRKSVPCTQCAYCMPCPQDINIPFVLNLYNEKVIYESDAESKRMYNMFGRQASKCIACGKCNEKCPQSIKISEWMPVIDELLTVKLG